MKRLGLMFGTAAMAGFLAAAPVAAEDGNFYFGLNGFGGWSDPGDISTSGTGTIQERNTDDLAAGGGAAIGYRYGDVPIRVELEVMHRVRVDVDLRDTTNNIGYENNLASTTAMLGMAYEFRDEGNWTPFVGGHVGVARNTSEVTRSNIAAGTSATTETDDDNLAVAASVGIDYAATEVLDFGAAYRFSYLGGFDTGTLGGGDSIDGDPFTAHDLVLTVRFNF
jgi:opacity protein-like surface antigen